MAISASEKPLQKVFTSDYRFTIPSFQRAYQWKRQQMTQLIDDIVDACRTNVSPYFLGSLILVRDRDNRYEVIDGQQRLVSLTILFAVLLYLEQDESMAASLDGLIMENGDKLRRIEPEPRLRVRDQDEEFFREYIQQGNLESLFDLRESDCATQAQRNMYYNVRYAFDELGSMSSDERAMFRKFLVNDVMFVIVTTDDMAGAYRIFDVMNMRGLPLTTSDVFKAKIVSHITPSMREAYARYWDDIMGPFGDDSIKLEQFFTDLYLIVTGKPAYEQLLNDFTDDVLMQYLNEQRAGQFVDEILRPYAAVWNMIDRPLHTVLPANIRERLAAFQDYPTHDWRPVVMWCLVHSITNIADPAVMLMKDDESGVPAALHDMSRLAAILEALDCATGVDALNGVGSIERRTRACKAIRDLRNGAASVQRVSGFVVSQDDQRTAMMRLRGELTVSDDMKRLLLVRANEQANGGHIVRPRLLNAVRLLPEHITKDSSFAQWPAELCDYWGERIGNYVLTQAKTSIIEPLGDFEERRNRIIENVSSRRFPLTAQLHDLAALTPEALETRQRETVKLIAQAWHIRYDEHHTDLTIVPESKLKPNTDHRARPTSKRVTIAEAVKAGLLRSGETLVWERPRKHERWEVTVTASGLKLPDGREFSSPTAAAKAVSGGSMAKLDVWKRTETGQSLAEVWKGYRRRH